MIRINKKITITLFIAMLMLVNSVPVFGAEKYVHNPMENPKAAADIVVNPNAVYGYSPNQNSELLMEYADGDWSDPAFVEDLRKQREEFHDSIKELYGMFTAMKTAGADVKDIAIAVSTGRNEIRLESYKDDPDGLAGLKKSNLEKYGNENGGTPEYYYKKYGSWETVIEKALSSDPGADACLGLYDEYYDTYFITASSTQTSDNQSMVKTEADVYTVVSGDTLSSIARNKLGDSNKWILIFNLNKDVIKNPNLIIPGQSLKLQ